MSSEITSSTARNRYWRSTAPTCQIFPSVACSFVRCMDDGIVHSLSMDDFTVVYRQLPRTTLLSSKEDLANDSWQSTLGNGRSLWTNWRCTNFLLSYQLPLRSKGRPGYRRNLDLIHMGLCEPRVTKSLVDFLCPFIFPK